MIKYEDQIEDLIKQYPKLNAFLISKGTNCIVCGEPAWGSIGDFLKQKGLDADAIIAEFNESLT
jgi:hypothetical protein